MYDDLTLRVFHSRTKQNMMKLEKWTANDVEKVYTWSKSCLKLGAALRVEARLVVRGYTEPDLTLV